MILFYNDAQAEVQQHVSTWVTLLSKVIWPALATLVPAGVTALFKMAQNHSRSRRSVELTERISQLAKYIAELPETPSTASGNLITPRAALTAELNLAVNELSALQSKARHSFRGVSTSATAKLRTALLLFRPKGLLAFTLHTLFYIYSALFLFCILAVLMTGNQKSGDTPFISTASPSAFFADFLAFIFLVGVFSIPPLVLHHYAIKIHRRQTSPTNGQELPVVPPIPATVSQQEV